ncbi:helix-turn-helix domain-containing protein [Chloroflexota bacterium]
MTRRRKDPLRPLGPEEWEILEQIARAGSEPASHVARAKALLAVADGKSYGAAAQAAGRRSNDAVSQLVSRFNQEGVVAVEPRHGGGPEVKYGTVEQARILAEVRRKLLTGITAAVIITWSSRPPLSAILHRSRSTRPCTLRNF